MILIVTCIFVQSFMNNKPRFSICVGLVAVLICTGATGVSRRCCCEIQVGEIVSCCKTRAAGGDLVSERPTCCRSADSFEPDPHGFAGDSHGCDCVSGNAPEPFRKEIASGPICVEIALIAFADSFCCVSEGPKALAVSVPLTAIKAKRFLLCVWRL